MTNGLTVAFDIGGTKTLIGLVDRRGNIVRMNRFATDITKSAEDHLGVMRPVC